MLIKVPVEYKLAFKKKPARALASIAGFSQRSMDSFLRDTSALERYSTRPDPMADGVLAPWFKGIPGVRYYVHVDLSLRRDRCGVAMGHRLGGRKIIDLATLFEPRVRGEVDVTEVCMFVANLKVNRGFSIILATYDSYQSAQSLQLLRRAGIRAETFSVDKDTAGYDCMRDCLYDGSLDIYDSPVFRAEAKRLVLKLRKVDHPRDGSKDLTDAVSAVTHHLVWMEPEEIRALVS